MTTAIDHDLKKLKARAFDRAEWAEDVLRRYHATTLNLNARVALEAGNSPAVIFSNYRELVTPQDTKLWFDIKPSKN